MNNKQTKVGQVTHGMWKSKEWNSWNHMKQRCLNPKHPRFLDYAGRGIKICDRWMDFENFFSDMGFSPSPKHSIDRIDNDGNYEPNNCRWATQEQQVSNRRISIKCVYNDSILTVKEWSAIFGLIPKTVRRHLKGGKTLDEIIKKYKEKEAK